MQLDLFTTPEDEHDEPVARTMITGAVQARLQDYLAKLHGVRVCVSVGKDYVVAKIGNKIVDVADQVQQITCNR